MNDLRMLVPLTDAEIETLFARLGYRVQIDDLVFTGDTIEDFWFARYQAWEGPGTVLRHEPGLLVVHDARPGPLSTRRDLVVVGFVRVRVALGIDRQETGRGDLPGMPVALTLSLELRKKPLRPSPTSRSA